MTVSALFAAFLKGAPPRIPAAFTATDISNSDTVHALHLDFVHIAKRNSARRYYRPSLETVKRRRISRGRRRGNAAEIDPFEKKITASVSFFSSRARTECEYINIYFFIRFKIIIVKFIRG